MDINNLVCKGSQTDLGVEDYYFHPAVYEGNFGSIILDGELTSPWYFLLTIQFPPFPSLSNIPR